LTAAEKAALIAAWPVPTQGGLDNGFTIGPPPGPPPATEPTSGNPRGTSSYR